MRSIGLAALLLGTLAFLLPWYRIYVPEIRISGTDAQLLAGLLVAVGALTLAIHGRR